MSKFSTFSTAMLCFVGFLFLAVSCRDSAEGQTKHSEAKVDVVEAIMDTTTQWAEANQQRNAAAVLDMFVNSEELRHAENGVIFPSYEALANFVESWYDSIEEMDLIWEQRAVVPLSPDAATLIGIFRYEARQKSGEVWSGRNVFTGVFVRREGSWKLIHGHESSVPAPQVQ